MDETLQWFTHTDFSQYEDKYISIVNKEVVCADDDPEVVYAEAKKKFPNEEIILWKVLPNELYIFKVA